MEGFKIFKETFTERIREAFPEAAISITVALKTNVSEEQITVIPKESNIGPSISLTPIFERYKMGEAMEQLVEDTVKVVSTSFKELPDVPCFSAVEHFRENIVFSVMNADANKELLEQLPHFILAGDIAVYYRWVIRSDENGRHSTKVTYDLLNKVEVDEGDLYALAYRNTKVITPLKVRSMEDMLREFGMPVPFHSPISIVSNETAIEGAAMMVYKSVFEQMAEEEGCNLIIIPSSIHEILVLPEKDFADNRGLVEIVEEVNTTQVSPNERLSNSVFIFGKGSGIEVFTASDKALL